MVFNTLSTHYMKKFLLFLFIGVAIYTLLSVSLTFLDLEQEVRIGISSVSFGLIQGYIGYRFYGTKKSGKN